MKPLHSVGIRAVSAIAVGVVLASSLALAQWLPTRAPRSGTVTIRPGFIPDPRNANTIAGGPLAAPQVASPHCAGWITAQPSLVMSLTGLSPWMRIYATSTADTTLIVRRPDGSVLCADNTYGRNPAVEGVFAAGRYAIWVGSAQQGVESPVTVSFTELEGYHP